MLPGQEINKDVYAVNTGSIAAFVKESISGVLNYTFESPVVNLDTVNCVKLAPAEVTSIDGATTMEAGGTLAYTSVTEGTTGYIAPGTVVSARESEDPAVASRWTPTASGVYIFRRSIKPAQEAGEGYDPDFETNNPTATEEEIAANAALAPQPEKYTYAGYYYDKDTDSYYKIVIGSDPFRAYQEVEEDDGTMSFVFDVSVESDNLGGTATAGADGIIEGTPDIHYVMLNTVKDADVNFIYVAADDADNEYNGVPYLKVAFDNESGDMGAANAALEAANEALDAAQAALTEKQEALAALQTEYGPKSKALAEAEVALRNAEGAYNSAKSRYDQTKADYDYAVALKNATADLITAANARKAAEDTRETKLQDLIDAADAINYTGTTDTTNKLAKDQKDTFDSEVANFATNYGFSTLVPTAVENYINNNGPDGMSDLSGAKQNMESLRALWGQIQDLIDAIDTDYENLEAVTATGDKTTDTTPATINGYKTSLNNHVDALTTAIANYKATYAEFTAGVTEATLSGLTGTNNNSLTGMTFTDSTDAMDTAIGNYVSKYNDYYGYLEGDYATAVGNWANAVSDYNTAVSGAKTTYDVAIGTEQDEPNAFGGLVGDELEHRTLTDNGADLVRDYSAFAVNGLTAAPTNNPTIADNTANEAPDNNDETAYTLYEGGTAPTVAPEATFTQLTGDPDTATQQALGTAASSSGLYQAMTVAENALTAAQGAYDTANTNFPAADQATLAAAQAEYEAAQAAVAARQADVANVQANIAAAASNSQIQIDVVLDSKVNNGAADETWKFDTRTNNTAQADFYLDKILEAGETSPKLVDYVVLNKNTSSADYKDLTFDLNVELKSAQVAYSDDQRRYTADAVNANDDFAMTAAVDTTDNSTVTWTVT